MSPDLNQYFKSHAKIFKDMKKLLRISMRQSVRKFSVAYHSAVKRTSGLKKRGNNQIACETLGVDSFKQGNACRMVSCSMCR